MGRLFCLALLPIVTGPAMAQETTVYLGVAVTSDYVSSGQTQTDGQPAVQPYVEVAFASGLYLGIWASNVDFGGDDSAEIDLYGGFRGEAGALSYDLSYYRYYYDDSGYDSGEVTLALGVAANDSLSLALELSSDLEGGISVTPGFALTLPAAFALSGSVDFYNDDGGESWDIGISRYLTDTVSLDLRWYDASYVDEGRAALTLSWDTDWATLTGGAAADTSPRLSVTEVSARPTPSHRRYQSR